MTFELTRIQSNDSIFEFNASHGKKSPVILLGNRLTFGETTAGYFPHCQKLEKKFEIEQNLKSPVLNSKGDQRNQLYIRDRKLVLVPTVYLYL